MGDLPFWIQQLIYQTPALLVYLFGLLLGWAFARRHPVPALLTALGCAGMCAVSLLLIALQSYLLERVRARELTVEEYRYWVSPAGLLANCAQALGFALVLVAVFAGRVGGRTRRESDSSDAER